MNDRRLRRITIAPPEIRGQAVTVRWTVEPATWLYRRCHFTLWFPDDLDLGRVPEGLWWTIALACLHPHWAFLRPCQVHLPVTLAPGAAEVWLRLVDAEVATVEALREGGRHEREVEIVERGPRVAMTAVPDSARCATAFSGGKDSLVQVGILTELTDNPVLVTTTSPLPGMSDHLTARRRHVLAAVPARRKVRLVEVGSDYRGAWVNAFPWSLGYRIALSEVTDSHLYFSALLAVGAALGTPHLFLASETEVQENAEIAGRVVQHPHAMYSTATQRALQALLEPAGIRYGSLTSPLHSFQVQQLLWTRYADLRDLQYSCWSVGSGEAACSRCPQCLRLALGVLALGDTPARMGIDLTRLLCAQGGWTPARVDGAAAPLPGRAISVSLDRQVSRSIVATPPGLVLRALAGDGWHRLARPGSWRALRAYQRLRRQALADPPGDAPGFRAGFADLIDPLLRERVLAIFDAHFSREAEAAYADVLCRSHRLARWMTDPVQGDRSAATQPERGGTCSTRRD